MMKYIKIIYNNHGIKTNQIRRIHLSSSSLISFISTPEFLSSLDVIESFFFLDS